MRSSANLVDMLDTDRLPLFEQRLTTLEQSGDLPAHLVRDVRECLHSIEAKLPDLSPLDWRVSRKWHGLKRRIEMLLHKSNSHRLPYRAEADMTGNGNFAGLLTRNQKRRWRNPDGRSLPQAIAKIATIEDDSADSPRERYLEKRRRRNGW